MLTFRVRLHPTGLYLGKRLIRPSSIKLHHTRAINTDGTTFPVGVARALAGSSTASGPTLFTQEFSLAGRVALVTGANRGIGLESALALSEAGARSVYCLDVHEEPGEEWRRVSELVAQMGLGSFRYICGDVRDQKDMWKVGETIGDREGRLDVCVASAGIFKGITPSLEYPDAQFQEVVDVNLKGMLFTAQAAGRQMARFNTGGSIVFIASICGSVAFEPVLLSVSYHSTKSAILQMARSMACELGSKGIRVNTLSPGIIRTQFTAFLDQDPELKAKYCAANPLGRIGRPEELRGAVAWLTSDASSFCTGSDIIVSGGHQIW